MDLIKNTVLSFFMLIGFYHLTEYLFNTFVWAQGRMTTNEYIQGAVIRQPGKFMLFILGIISLLIFIK